MEFFWTVTAVVSTSYLAGYASGTAIRDARIAAQASARRRPIAEVSL